MTFRAPSDILSDEYENREHRDKRNPKTVMIPEDMMKIFGHNRLSQFQNL
jgi:hypothetical protein